MVMLLGALDDVGAGEDVAVRMDDEARADALLRLALGDLVPGWRVVMDTTAGMAARATWLSAERSWRTERCCASTHSRPLSPRRAPQAGAPRVPHSNVASETPLHHRPPVMSRLRTCPPASGEAREGGTGGEAGRPARVGNCYFFWAMMRSIAARSSLVMRSRGGRGACFVVRLTASLASSSASRSSPFTRSMPSTLAGLHVALPLPLHVLQRRPPIDLPRRQEDPESHRTTRPHQELQEAHGSHPPTPSYTEEGAVSQFPAGGGEGR